MKLIAPQGDIQGNTVHTAKTFLSSHCITLTTLNQTALVFQLLESERQRTLHQLQDQHSEAEKLSAEKKEMSELTTSLQSTLKEIEDKTQQLLEEKRKAEER